MTAEKTEKKTTYCFECVWWKPQNNNTEAVYGRCGDLKEKTMRLDHCDTDKISSKPQKVKK